MKCIFKLKVLYYIIYIEYLFKKNKRKILLNYELILITIDYFFEFNTFSYDFNYIELIFE